MKCQDEVAKMCMKAIKYKKYANIRRCDKCCIDCNNPCGNLCDIALELKNKAIEEDDHVKDR